MQESWGSFAVLILPEKLCLRGNWTESYGKDILPKYFDCENSKLTDGMSHNYLMTFPAILLVGAKLHEDNRLDAMKCKGRETGSHKEKVVKFVGSSRIAYHADTAEISDGYHAK